MHRAASCVQDLLCTAIRNGHHRRWIDVLQDKLELIAAGQAVAIVAAGLGSDMRPDLTTIPLEGVEPSHVVLATRADDTSRLTAAFRKCATEHIHGPLHTG